VTTILIAYYAGAEDRELDGAIVRAVGPATWRGAGQDRDGRGVEHAWELASRDEAEALAARLSSGVSRGNLSIRLRTKGPVEK